MAYPFARYIVPIVYRLWIRKVKGIENLPKDKPFIIAANHSSYFDAFLLPSIVVPVINRKMHAWVNAIYWKNPISRFFLEMWGGIPMHVSKEQNAKEKNKESFKLTLKYLKRKEPIMIFPEGARNDGTLIKAYPGIARLALSAKVPVLPCGIIDANKVWPKHKLPRFKRCEVKIGRPLRFSQKPSKTIYDEVTTKIMKEIAKLINQEYPY